VKNFKPFKAPNEVIELKDIKFPQIVSYKLDGFRCIFKDGEMFTSALKHFRNIHLLKRFEHLAKLSLKDNIILDGELRAKSLSFNDLSGIIRSDEQGVPEDLYFYCFDIIIAEDYNKPFKSRIQDIAINCLDLPYLKNVAQLYLTDNTRIPELFKIAIEEEKCDGLILRNPEGRYKLGRGTIKEALIFKLKPYRTFDSKIIKVLQATEVDPSAEKKINELGRSVTSKKIGDRVLIEKASAFLVLHKGKELKVTIAMTDEEKTEVWENQKKYIGKMIEYKGMLVGSKDLPRHPVFLRFRPDKD